MTMQELIVYLETRIKALDILIKLHNSQTGDYLVMERAICLIQLDKIKVKLTNKEETNNV